MINKFKWDRCSNGNKKTRINRKNRYYVIEHHIADVDDFQRFYSIYEYDRNNTTLSVNVTFSDDTTELYESLSKIISE